MDEQLVSGSVVAGLREGLGGALVAVVLYGSRARGTARRDSDWDVLIVARGLPDRVFQRHVAVKRMLPSAVRGAVSVYARTPEELEAAWPLPSLYYDIALDGRVWYDTGGFAARWLASARWAMEAQGWYRDHTPFGDLWRRRMPVGVDIPA